ncbi:hypothetical protein D3C84_931030 [compost metagenome]
MMALKPQAAMPTWSSMTINAMPYLSSMPPLMPILSRAATARSRTIQVMVATQPMGISTCMIVGR